MKKMRLLLVAFALSFGVAALTSCGGEAADKKQDVKDVQEQEAPVDPNDAIDMPDSTGAFG